MIGARVEALCAHTRRPAVNWSSSALESHAPAAARECSGGFCVSATCRSSTRQFSSEPRWLGRGTVFHHGPSVRLKNRPTHRGPDGSRHKAPHWCGEAPSCGTQV